MGYLSLLDQVFGRPGKIRGPFLSHVHILTHTHTHTHSLSLSLSLSLKGWQLSPPYSRGRSPVRCLTAAWRHFQKTKVLSEPESQQEFKAKVRGLSPASEATHKGLDTAGRRRIWHPRTPLTIARQMLQPRHVCRASLPPGGEATQLQTGALEGVQWASGPRTGAPPGLIPEAVLSCGGCMEPFPELFQRSSWGQRAESRGGVGGVEFKS